MNNITTGFLVLFLFSTTVFAESWVARSVICITNNTNKDYVLDVVGIDPSMWRLGNRPDLNLDGKVIPPGKHICKKEEPKVDQSYAVAGASEKIDTFTVTVRRYYPVVAARELTLPSIDDGGRFTYNHFNFDLLGNGLVHWDVKAEQGPENKGQTDEGVFYSTEFVNAYGEVRETEACPAPYKHDKDCQSFEILN